VGPFSIIAFFCEDVREETSGTHTIVGVLPDNLNIGATPGMLPKLGVYVRIQMPLDANPQKIVVRIKVPGELNLELAKFDSLIEEAKTNARNIDMPFFGLIAKGTLSPLPIAAPGRIEAIVEIDGREHICGALNLIQSPGPTPASNEPSPPA
jgi:hypothetical protein